MVIPCDEMHRSYVNLPEIEAHEGVVAVIGQTVKSMEMLRAIELLDLMKGRQWHEPRAVRKIEVPGTWNVTAVVRPQGRFIFPVEGNSLSLCLDRLQAVLHATVREGREVATVDLQPARNVPVTFVADEPESVALEFPDEQESAEDSAGETAAVAPARGSGKTEKTEKTEKMKTAVSGGVRSLAVTARPARTAVPQSVRTAAGNAKLVSPAKTVSARPVVAKPSVAATKPTAAKPTVMKPKSSAAAKSSTLKSSTVRAPASKVATVKPSAKSSPAKPVPAKSAVRKTVAGSSGAVRGSAVKTVPVKAGAVRSDAVKPVVRKNVSGPKGIPASVRGAAMKPANSRT